jgi:hypothetical protein
VDSERSKLLADFDFAGLLEELTWIDDFHAQRQRRNGGGDPYHTDGRLPVVVIAVRAESRRSGEQRPSARHAEPANSR